MFDLFSDPGRDKPLRPHQADAITLVRNSLLGTGIKRVVCAMPTGAGKTRFAAELVNMANARGNRVAFTVPALSLIDQTIESFENEGIYAINVMQGNHPRKDPNPKVHVISVQTLAKRERPDVGMVIVDECHIRSKVISQWMQDCPATTFIGLSATPWTRGMADEWQALVSPVTIQQLIDAGYLSPFRVFAPSHPDLTTVRTKAGDYHEGDLSVVMSDNRLVADVVTTWKQRAAGLPTLVFAVDRAHAETLQGQFAASGVAMGYCDAYTDRVARKVLFDRMARGEIAGICNVGTLTTGVDADVRCVVIARPTKSEMLFCQQIGRALRTAPGKSHAVILDHADNHARLGFVTDIHHGRLLSGSEKTPPTAREKGEKTPKECPKCGVLLKSRECFACGFVAQRVSEVEPEAGELVEVKARKPKAAMVDKQAFWSMAQHVDAERGKGGKLALALYKAKFGVWPRGLDDARRQPDAEFLSYERSRRIARSFAKRRAAA